MQKKSTVLLITTLAEYQTAFWIAIGLELRKRHQAVAFLSFDDRSSETLRAQGFLTFQVTPTDEPADISDAAVDVAMERFGIRNLNYWFSHERYTFGIRKSDDLRRKLLTYLSLADRTCDSLKQEGHDIILVQELGGFLSVIASFFAARRQGVDNWFIEPAFFRGRLFFLKNDFAALKIRELPDGAAVSPQVRDYIAATLASGTIVVPKKDRHQYTTAFSKIINLRNFKRLVEKLTDKYIHGKRQEFSHIGRYVLVHARMLLNSLRLRGSYITLSHEMRFVYYPLHVPGDMALTLRSPQFLDQLALIDYLARIVPHTHKVAIKEHPAMIGAIDAGRLKELVNRYDNLIILPPSTNNYEVLRAADVIVSVNSKSGAEAALLNKPVIVLGDAFYRDSPLVQALDSLTQLPEALRRFMENPKQLSNDHAAVEPYFEAVWRESFVGELYVSDPENVAQFTDALLRKVVAQ